ncbi:MAG: Xaa-Pro peptidase family protein [Thermodesulfovibrionales bacterium]|nr:Xaa-Pro peptidase family protein [Thermodesulfovibrionales bacterium]
MDNKRHSIIKEIQDKIRQRRLYPLIVTDITNVRYLTGFTGSSGFCFLTDKDAMFFTDFRYVEQAESEVCYWDLCVEKGKRIETIKKTIRKLGIKRVGFEASQPYLFYEQLSRLGLKTKAYKNLIERYREIKDEVEISHIKEAYKRAETAFLEIKQYIRPGFKESDIALKLEMALKDKGCKRIPFDIIVASGSNSSRPHATVTNKTIEKGDFVIIDWGGECNGYFSDITRTFLIKDANLDKKIEIYEIVKTACHLAVSSVKTGMKAKDIDKIARDHISKHGYRENFGHATGHSIGLQIHEEPRINKVNNTVIKEGMVFTIEPGIYIRDFGGVRIEDTVHVLKGQTEQLCNLPKELEILG